MKSLLIFAEILILCAVCFRIGQLWEALRREDEE